MHFLGHTRFSLFTPGSPNWIASSRLASEKAYRDHLFDDERLETRTTIFTEHSLPQLAAAKRDHDLMHVVSYPAELPANFKSRLQDAAGAFEGIVLDEVEGAGSTLRPAEAFADAFADVKRGGPFGFYRLDDDDVLSINFFDRVASLIDEQSVGMLVSQAQGFGAMYDHGYYSQVVDQYAPMVAIGLTKVCRFVDGELVAPREVAHNRSDRANPVILDARAPSFLHVRHSDQDSAAATTVISKRERVQRELDELPMADQKAFAAEFPTIAPLASWPSSTTLMSQPQPLIDRIPLVFPQPVHGKFRVNVSLDCAGDVVASNALVSLHLVDSGQDANPSRVAVSGATFSEHVGLYSYLITPPGKKTTGLEFGLPAGVSCVGADIRRWRAADTGIIVKSAVLMH